MTESNITKEHEGKHGVLTLGGSRNDVTIVEVTMGAFRVRIDGSESMNSFYLSDGWQFIPDPDPLSTEPGWYVQASDTGGVVRPVLYFLSLDGLWFIHYGTSARQQEVNLIPPALLRVSFGDAS